MIKKDLRGRVMLKGKNIVIFGGTSGIGLSCAESLSSLEANLFIVGRNQEKLEALQNHLPRTDFFCLDLEQADDSLFNRCADVCIEKMKKVDGMVYSAGTADILPIKITTRDSVKRVFSTNYYGFLSAVNSFWGRHESMTDASIVAVSSGAVVEPSTCQTVYASSKSALNASVKSLAKELHHRRVRVNAVMPWVVDTKMIRHSIESGLYDSVRFDEYRAGGGVLLPQQIAEVVVFLLSDRADAITGTAIRASGGCEYF